MKTVTVDLSAVMDELEARLQVIGLDQMRELDEAAMMAVVEESMRSAIDDCPPNIPQEIILHILHVMRRITLGQVEGNFQESVYVLSPSTTAPGSDTLQ